MGRIFGRERGFFSKRSEETKKEIEPVKSERDILIDRRIEMHNELHELNEKYKCSKEEWPEEARKEFDEKKKKIDDEIRDIENKTQN